MGLVDRFRTGKWVRTLRAGNGTPGEALAEAKQALVEMGNAAIDPMLECLATPGRESAIEVLARITNSDTLPLVVAALASPDRSVSGGAREALIQGKAYRAQELIPYLSEKTVPNARLEPVLKARASELPAQDLLAILPDLERDARGIAFRLVEDQMDESLQHDTIRLLAHTDWWIRLHAAKLLGQLSGEEVEKALSSILTDQNKNVRLEAVKSLAGLKSRLAIPFLANVLRDGDLTVQAAAIDALISIDDPGAVPHLVEVLKDESEQCRRGAVEVLNEVATTEAIQDLVHALRDADWWVRVRSADALGTIGGDKVVEAILGLMEDEDVHIRRYAVEILNTVPDGRSVESLIHALADDDWWVRERSIDALGRTGDPRAIEPLGELLRTDEEASVLCAKALGEIESEESVNVLLKAAKTKLTDEAHSQVVTSLKQLSRLELDGTTRGRLEKALGDEGVRIEKTKLRPMEVKKAPSKGSPEDASMVQPRDHAPAPAHPDAPTPPSPPPTRAPMRADDVKPGDVLLDRYRITERIGAGGFSTVFLVEDTAIEENLILKILSHQLAAEENSLARFVQELKLARRVAHPNVIRIHDLLEIEGVRAISMEYFGGADLGRVLDRSGRLVPERARNIAFQIASGLAAAHDQGIIHRDVKPANVLVNEEDVVKIVDFGLAAASREAENRLTRTGHLVGTPHYMAPELIRGEEIDVRADIYSLGVLLYEMVAGKLPYDGDNPMNVLFKHLDGDAAHVSTHVDVPPAFGDLVMRVMALDPADRPATASQLADELRALEL